MFNPTFKTVSMGPFAAIKDQYLDKMVDGVLHTMFPRVITHKWHKAAGGVSVLGMADGSILMLYSVPEGKLALAKANEGVTLSQIKSHLDLGINSDAKLFESPFAEGTEEDMVNILKY